MGLRGPKARPPSARFAEKVVATDSGCIEWTAGTNGVGYGVFHVDETGRKAYAHRWAYEQRFGPIPKGLHLDHLCRNTLCVNPDHLEPVTPRENLVRGTGFAGQNASKTACPWGHSYSTENTYINPNTGSRACLTCRRRRDRLRRRTRREAV